MTNAARTARLESLEDEIVECRACPRLVAWREEVALERRAAFRDWTYWGRPVPGYGDPDAEVLVVGLAPAAHGGNRTGRIFTGDRSGDWLFASLYRTGFANQPTSEHRQDGLRLSNIWISAAVKCAPPANKPTLEERDACTSRFLSKELKILDRTKVIVCLGKFAYDVAANLLRARQRPPFGHGVTADVGGMKLLASFHPSQQNTFTGKLTEEMLDSVFEQAFAVVS